MYYSFAGLLHPVVEKPLESTATALHPLPKKSLENTQKIQFHSERGSKATQKVDLFAEQNAKQAEKRVMQAKRRKKVVIASSILGSLVVISVIIVALLNMPKNRSEEDEVTTTTISDYNTIQNESQQEFDGTNKTASEIISYYDKLINNSTSNEQKATLHISEISSLAQNGFMDEAIQSALKFEESLYRQSSNQAQLSIYYGIMINIYSSSNDNERVEYYLDLLQQTEFKPDTEVIG